MFKIQEAENFHDTSLWYKTKKTQKNPSVPKIYISF